MKRPPLSVILVAAAVLTGVATARAQTRLIVVEGNDAQVVRSVELTTPFIANSSGKLVHSEGTRFGLKPVDEYYPAIVDVNDLNVRTSSLSINGGANRINNDIEVHATLSSRVSLDRVFVVLELHADMGPGIFLWGVGQIEANSPVPLSIVVPTVGELGSGHFTLHVFSDGVEVFNSSMGILNIYHHLDRMVVKRTRGVNSARPIPLMSYQPIYPKDLKKQHIAGNAILDVNLDRKGMPGVVKVVSATDPKFGASAKECVLGWRFIPMVKNGYPVESLVRIPFDFSAPKDS